MASNGIASTCRDLSRDMLHTRIGWLAHDLDKTINTASGEASLRSARRESAALGDHLAEWARRGLEDDETTLWACALQADAERLVRNLPHEETVSPQQSWNADELCRLLAARRSVRQWRQEPLSRDALARLIEAARWAPSACNRQSCRYLVITEAEGREAVAQARERWMAHAPALILVGADRRNYLPEEESYVPYMDAAMACQNLLLMAHAMGLGAVIVKSGVKDLCAMAGSAGCERSQHLYKALRLPPEFIPVAVIAVGFPKRIPKAPPRLPVERVAFAERFPCATAAAPGTSGLRRRVATLLLRVTGAVVAALGVRSHTTLE